MMTQIFDASVLLRQAGLAQTANRVRVVQALAEAGSPRTPQHLLERLAGGMNRVTLYRILDLLVEHGVATRHNAGERAFRYCLANDPLGHAHFLCTRCGETQCLESSALQQDFRKLLASLPMRVEGAEFRLSGVCEVCLSA
jgi:Fur family ferric uptake transcriptional regulator